MMPDDNYQVVDSLTIWFYSVNELYETYVKFDIIFR